MFRWWFFGGCIFWCGVGEAMNYSVVTGILRYTFGKRGFCNGVYYFRKIWENWGTLRRNILVIKFSYSRFFGGIECHRDNGFGELFFTAER